MLQLLTDAPGDEELHRKAGFKNMPGLVYLWSGLIDTFTSFVLNPVIDNFVQYLTLHLQALYYS